MKEQPIPILMYHSVSKSSGVLRENSVLPVSFADHLSFLKENGYQTKTVTQLIHLMSRQETSGSERFAVLTFDDGYEDFYNEAFPILQKFGFVATVYVPTALVGRTSLWMRKKESQGFALMNWSQIKELNANGIEFGSHGQTHAALDTLPLSVAYNEIFGSKHVLEEQLGEEVHSFCYPYGYYDKQTQSLVRQAGYSSACAVRLAMSSLADNPYALSRIHVVDRVDKPQFASILCDGTLPVSPKQDRLRTQARLFVRRWVGKTKYVTRLQKRPLYPEFMDMRKRERN